MTQQTERGPAVGVASDVVADRSIPAWDPVHRWRSVRDRTPDPGRLDTAVAASIAAEMLNECRVLRRRFGDLMFGVDSEPRALRLHELLHLTERHALAAQRHGVEALTARLRSDEQAADDVARELFDRVEAAAGMLSESLILADLLSSVTRDHLVDGPARVGSDGSGFPSSADAERVVERMERADRMRRHRPIPDTFATTPAPTIDEYERREDLGPGAASIGDHDVDDGLDTDLDQPPTQIVEPIELRAEPVAADDDPVDEDRDGVADEATNVDETDVRTSSVAELVVLDREARGARIHAGPRDILLLLLLLGLIAVGMYLLLSGNSIIG